MISLKDDSKFQGLLHSFDPTDVNFIIISNPKLYNKELKVN